MRILQLHTKMVSGGIEAIVCGLANEMGVTEDVTLCTIFMPTDEDVFYKKISNKVKKDTIGKLHFGFSVKEIFKIYNFIRKGKYDVVHLHGCFQYYFLSILLLYKKTSFFYTIHSDAKMENLTTTRYLHWLKRWMFRKQMVIPVTISNVSQSSFTDYYRCPSELVFNGTPKPVIKNKTNIIDELRFTPKTKVFVHAGRISDAKNQLVLCRVFRRIIKEGKDVVLAIAGNAEDKAIFSLLEPYFNDRLVFLGERSDVPELFSKADAFCLPSKWEGLPVTLLEALSVGCIPICSPVGGIVNVIHSGENGILSVDYTEDAYYDAISTFLSLTDSEIGQMETNALKSFEKYDMTNCAAEYIKLYQKYKKKL